MKLDSIEPGLLVFVAGGTGLYPYMDLVDLLFKSQVIDKERDKHLLEQNPILSIENCF